MLGGCKGIVRQLLGNGQGILTGCSTDAGFFWVVPNTLLGGCLGFLGCQSQHTFSEKKKCKNGTFIPCSYQKVFSQLKMPCFVRLRTLRRCNFFFFFFRRYTEYPVTSISDFANRLCLNIKMWTFSGTRFDDCC